MGEGAWCQMKEGQGGGGCLSDKEVSWSSGAQRLNKHTRLGEKENPPHRLIANSDTRLKDL